MHLDLSELSQLAPIFRELFKGFHVSRRDPELYAQLSNFQDQYRTLFKALGFELVCDTRGFYYFVPEQAAAQVNKTAQRLSLFTFILVEHLADQGRDPMVVLDGGSIGRDELPSLLDKYRDLFLQAEVQTVEELEEKILRRMTQLGFAHEEGGIYRFLPPCTVSSMCACRCSRTATWPPPCTATCRCRCRCWSRKKPRTTQPHRRPARPVALRWRRERGRRPGPGDPRRATGD